MPEAEKFMWDPKNPIQNNYDAILLLDKSVQLFEEDRPSAIRQQITMHQWDYEVIDLTIDSDTTPMQQHVYFPYNNDM